MVKLRRNHGSGASGKGVFGRSVIITLLIGLFYIGSKFLGLDLGSSMENTPNNTPNNSPEELVVPINPEPKNPEPKEKSTKVSAEYSADFNAFMDVLPAMQSGIQPVAQETFALGYSETHEQAAWVAYTINREFIDRKAKREDAFVEDRKVVTGSAHPDDYRGSGYSRGHLIAAADRSGRQEWMNETFLMSNMSPQAYNMNGGVWRELEELVRNWAWYYRDLKVVTGPDLRNIGTKKIGKYNKITVPDYFYKVVYAPDAKGIRAIGFYVPNEKSDAKLETFAMSIDEIEAKTGLDFFVNLPDDLESKVEKDNELSDWKFDDKKYKKRVEVWNNY